MSQKWRLNLEKPPKPTNVNLGDRFLGLWLKEWKLERAVKERVVYVRVRCRYCERPLWQNSILPRLGADSLSAWERCAACKSKLKREAKERDLRPIDRSTEGRTRWWGLELFEVRVIEPELNGAIWEPLDQLG